MKKLLCLALAFVMLFGLTACKGNDDGYFKDDFYEEFPTGDEIYTVEIDRNPEVTITLSDGSEIVIELCYDAAPNAVASFLAYAKEDIYESMAFTEVRNSCIVMTDVPDGDFVSPFYTMDETENNSLSHTRGTVSMIRTTSDNTLTGRFFVLTKDQVHFDNNFTAFGKVIEGMEIIDAIAASEVDDDYKIAEPLSITKVSVKTFGEKIPNPTIILK
mgnify:CR=1 FL=1